MRNASLPLILILCLAFNISCSQNKSMVCQETKEVSLEEVKETIVEAHQYGGWYCPDNLNGFPAVDIRNWKKVPVVKGRLATKEETQNGQSLIFVDIDKYPQAKPLDIDLPKLAHYYNMNTKRKELIIIIQAINISNDSIVGFRYLNGGNGSARLKEVQILSEKQINQIPTARYFTHSIEISTTQDVIWKVLTQSEYSSSLQPIFDSKNHLKPDWKKTTNVNYRNPNALITTASYAGNLYGNFYIQNDYDILNYTEKFFLSEDSQTKTTELKIVSGPYGNDYDTQKNILIKWAQKVKEISEER